MRRGRPHRGDADPVLCHDEFAVTVESGDRLLTWRYRALAATDGPRDGEQVIPGAPRVAASVVDETTYDGADVAAAGEALVGAQEDAARREREAVARSHAARDAGELALEHRAESESTRDALRRLTGQ